MYEKALPLLVVGCGTMGNNYLRIHIEELGIPEEQITAVDQDSAKVDACRQKWPGTHCFTDIGQALAFREHMAAFTLVNTPSHYRILEQLINHGVKYHLVEKPLVYTRGELEKLDDLTSSNKDVIIRTGYVINFSLAVARLQEIMTQGNFEVWQVCGIWGKNRCTDLRATPGDWEDEAVHPIATALTLIGYKSIRGFNVKASLSYLPFVDPTAQEKARQFDPSFPRREEVTSTSVAAIPILTDAPKPILVAVLSSFVSYDQRREIEVVMGTKGNTEFSHLAKLIFDKENQDHLYFKTKLNSEELHETFPGRNKLQDQIKAFLNGVETEEFDSRLTDESSAMLLVEATIKAEEEKNIQPGQMVLRIEM